MYGGIYMLLNKPYFLKNKDWYYYDMNTGKYALTRNAPKKTINSFNDYYKELDNISSGNFNNQTKKTINNKYQN